ncbi:MAG: hypothetical protein Q8K93_16530 [Reyranella sp.]|nr:hypothetical protein [Reyranella sp.]MDP1963798.1 hypothetical protein [Reyranella sp.]MDP2377581.1 hypothetical protein [Reyranella sp.]
MNDKKAGRVEIVVAAHDPRSGSSLVRMLVVGLVLAVIGMAVAVAVS